jgi:hypothetical protein
MTTNPQQIAEQRLIGQTVLIRDDLAGVYVGTLDAIDVAAQTAVLTGARQVWSWEGAAATPGIAARGLAHAGSRVGPVTEVVALGKVCAAILCTPEGAASVMGAPVWMS